VLGGFGIVGGIRTICSCWQVVIIIAVFLLAYFAWAMARKQVRISKQSPIKQLVVRQAGSKNGN